MLSCVAYVDGGLFSSCDGIACTCGTCGVVNSRTVAIVSQGVILLTTSQLRGHDVTTGTTAPIEALYVLRGEMDGLSESDMTMFPSGLMDGTMAFRKRAERRGARSVWECVARARLPGR